MWLDPASLLRRLWSRRALVLLLVPAGPFTLRLCDSTSAPSRAPDSIIVYSSSRPVDRYLGNFNGQESLARALFSSRRYDRFLPVASIHQSNALFLSPEGILPRKCSLPHRWTFEIPDDFPISASRVARYRCSRYHRRLLRRYVYARPLSRRQLFRSVINPVRAARM